MTFSPVIVEVAPRMNHGERRRSARAKTLKLRKKILRVFPEASSMVGQFLLLRFNSHHLGSRICVLFYYHYHYYS